MPWQKVAKAERGSGPTEGWCCRKVALMLELTTGLNLVNSATAQLFSTIDTFWNMSNMWRSGRSSRFDEADSSAVAYHHGNQYIHYIQNMITKKFSTYHFVLLQLAMWNKKKAKGEEGLSWSQQLSTNRQKTARLVSSLVSLRLTDLWRKLVKTAA